MKKSKPFVFVLIVCCITALSVTAQCTGCTDTVATSSTTNYTLTTGQKLCITSTGVYKGAATLNGGSICNQGIMQASTLTVTNGIIDNYGQIFQVGNLELSNTSVLNNYNFVEVQLKFLVNPSAKYLTQNDQAVLWVYPFSSTISPSTTAPYAKLSSSVDGGTYLASDGFLYFQYDEEYNAGTFKYKVYNQNNSVVMSDATDVLPVKAYGDNRYQLKVACKLALGNYLLEVTNDKNEVSYLKFKVNILQYCP